MAAFSLESAGKVRQKTYGLGLDPLVYRQLQAFFQYWSTHKGNADLQFIPFTGTSIDDATGQVLGTGAGTLYAIYARKGSIDQRTAGTATDAYVVVFDDATDDAGAGTDGRLVLPSLVASESTFYCTTAGIPLIDGLVVKSYTDFDGTTDSTAGDAPNGFCIVGA
jgi:hypothetical protein